ncbi:tRNA lysidine(34) synthetase TilS [bacterium]|jgi:tRNA(Ile)-lysidine synthase|nr:tRNA lysidine(34) synthetase TilS [bacterium]
MITKIYSFIQKHLLVNENDTVLIGLSGGPDSVFLTHILKQYQEKVQFKIILAHLNHGWREESIKDEQFCVNLAKSLDLPIEVAKISELSVSIKFNGSQEEVGRLYRRYFFDQVKKRYNATAIALAHTYDDQQENFFIRLLRGASLTGLTGIQQKKDRYIRPLLETKKIYILEFLKYKSIQYCVDKSNFSEDFLRNRIRKNVIPAIQKSDDRFDINFLKTLSNLQKAESFLENLAKETLEQITVKTDGKESIYTKDLSKQPEVMQHRIVVLWLCKNEVRFVASTSLIKEILRFLLSARGGSHLLYNTWTIEKKHGLANIKTKDQ